MVLHIRRVPERSERQGNPSLRGGLGKLCLRGVLLGVPPKSHNVPHRLGMGRLMSIVKRPTLLNAQAFRI